jgi:hypothetical protein
VEAAVVLVVPLHVGGGQGSTIVEFQAGPQAEPGIGVIRRHLQVFRQAVGVKPLPGWLDHGIVDQRCKRLGNAPDTLLLRVKPCGGEAEMLGHG